MKKLLMILPCVFLTACVYSQHTHQHAVGNVDTSQLAKLEIGRSDKAAVLSSLGVPDRVHTEKGLEVFEYVKDQRENSEKSFIFLFHLDSEKVIGRRVTQIVMRNGIVESVDTRDEKL